MFVLNMEKSQKSEISKSLISNLIWGVLRVGVVCVVGIIIGDAARVIEIQLFKIFPAKGIIINC